MEKAITDKLEYLLKYIPFIDFVLKIDKQKYIKFIDIRKWITIKKRYPLSDLNKIEQSIITQYKNLLLVDNKVPTEIMNIFRIEVKQEFISLLSDEEEDPTEIAKNKSKVNNEISKVEETLKTPKENIKKPDDKLDKIKHKVEKKSKSDKKKKNKKDKDKDTKNNKDKETKNNKDKDTKHTNLLPLRKRESNEKIADNNDSENDLEFVSEVKPKVEEQFESKKETKLQTATKSCDKNLPENILNLDDISEQLLRKIDVLSEDDKKNNHFHEPINYHKYSDDEDNCEVKQEVLYQRRTSEDTLFKRRNDFKDLTCKNIEEEKHKKPTNSKIPPVKILATISLDSSSASESEELSSDLPTTSAKALIALKSLNLDRNGKSGTPNLCTSTANNIVNEDMNRNSSVNVKKENNSPSILTQNLVDVEALNSKNNVTDTQTEKLNIATDTAESIDCVVLCGTESSADVSLLTDSKPNKSTDCQTNLKDCLNEDSSMGLLDMDFDTENDLNDVLNEINNPADSNLKTIENKCNTPAIFRNSSPPLKAAAVESVDTNSDKENLTTSTENLTNGLDTKNLRNLNQEQIYKIFEDIESKSDIEIDKLLQTLSNIFQNSTSNRANVSPDTPVSTKAINVQNDPTTPPAPHFISVPPQQHPIPQPQPQQPIFYPNLITTPFVPPQHIYHHSNQQQQIVPPPPHQYNVAPNFIPTPMSGMESSYPKINLKDPRIMRQLQLIKDSPIWNQFNRRNAEILTNAVCTNHQQQQHLPLPTFQQQHPHNPVTNIPATAGGTPAPIINCRKSTTKSKINFGEYKRRQIEQQQELERKREEEKKQKEEALKAKKAAELKEIEMREHLKSTREISSILHSTLEPYKEKLCTIWDQHCNNPNNSTTQQNKNDNISTKETIITSKSDKTKEFNDSHSQEDNNSNTNSCSKKKQDNRINRVYKELECNFKGFDQLKDYIPKTIGGKRRSSVHARSNISEQLNSQLSDDDSDHSATNKSISKSIGCRRRSSVYKPIDDSDKSDINSPQSTDNTGVPKLIGGRRRSSVSSRLAIAEQLNVSELSDYSDSSDVNSSQFQSCRDMSKLVAAKRKSSTLASSAISEQSIPDRRNSCTTKRRKTIDEPIHAKRRNKTFILVDESSSDSSSDEADFEKFRLAKFQRLKDNIINNQPTVALKRISQDFINKHTRRSAAVLTNRNVLNVHLVESKIRPSKIDKIAKSPTQKIAKPKKCNNDCQMTERNSKFCALCTSKPSDLTNHYKRKHKTESYVSRLTWSQLEDLSFNTPFAKLQPKVLNSRIDRYSVDCPFCEQHLVEPFMSLYNHYSTHTGEYAYRCSHCQLDKPYRADIQSHQLHSKTCRNNNTQVLYRYPPNSQCIYLHYCTICNFVQLNEANILKHLREHHDPRKAVTENVQKCILAAISDAPDITDKLLEEVPNQNDGDQQNLNIKQDKNIREIVPTSLSTVNKTEIDFKVDDDDIPVSNEACSQDIFEEDKFSLEEQLKQMHDETPAKIMPMTVIHCDNLTAKFKQTISPNGNANAIPILPPATNTNTLQKCLPMVLKGEEMDVDENLLITPPSPTTILMGANNSITVEATSNISPESVTLKKDQNTASTFKENPQTNSTITCSNDSLNLSSLFRSYPIYEKYHNYPENVNYLGLYKCMADDCYYSTDSSDEILKHLDDHSQDSSPNEYLQCPYCIIPANVQITPLQLIEHIRSQHQHMIYQCSICCYRSCAPSNVLVHQKHSHLTAVNTIVYKCSGSEINFNEKESYIKTKVVENVRKIACPRCINVSFYNTNFMVQHLIEHHKMRNLDLKIYSCIYCPISWKDQNSLHKHLAIKHPEELPYIYDHNIKLEIAQDHLINNLSLLSISLPVACLDGNPNCDSIKDEVIKDVKPELDVLIKMNEETAKVRLAKLTAHTGIPPDSLYRCPEPSCGGFFTLFDLWLRHMRIRHQCLECQCPHCPSKQKNVNDYAVPRTLESYAVHFEEHRRHTFICFYCSTTSRNEESAKQHAVEHHSNFAEMRLEQIRFNVSYSYFIMIQTELFTERAEFINELLVVLDKRLVEMESIEVENLKHQWLIQPDASWLEDLPRLKNNRLFKKCLDHTCKFRSVDEFVLFQHMNASHGSVRSQFNCRKCNQPMVCNNWNDIFEHRKQHSDSLFVCVACFKTYSNRSKLADHIKNQHAARDVPVIEHIKTRQEITFIKLAVVFANNHLTFSTIRNCFCCDEKNMNGDAFNLHLRRYHKLVLNYFCEWCINTQFKSLEEVKSHFQCLHPTAATKIRCELAYNGEIIVTSLDVFQLQIDGDVAQNVPLIEVKKEPKHHQDYDSNDDDVVLLEEDDIVIQESLQNHKLAEQGEKPKLKCVSLNNLLQAQCLQTIQPTPSSNPSVIQTQAIEGISQTSYGMQPDTSKLNSFQNNTAVDNKQFFTTTDYRHFNDGTSIVNNNNFHSSTSTAPNSTLNTPSNVQPGSSATTSYSTNNQNFANVSSQNYVLQNATSTHDDTKNNQNLANVGFQNYVLPNITNSLNTLSNPNTLETNNNHNYARTVISFPTDSPYYNSQSCYRRIGSYVGTSIQNHNFSGPVLNTCNSIVPTSSNVVQTSPAMIHNNL